MISGEQLEDMGTLLWINSDLIGNLPEARSILSENLKRFDGLYPPGEILKRLVREYSLG